MLSKQLPLAIALALASTAHASIDLIAIGSVSGAYEDMALKTAEALESGVPGNILGGTGSGLAYAGGNTFLALPDRGPNANSYNAAIDHTTSFIPRFQTFHFSLAPSSTGAPLPFVLTPMLQETTLFSSAMPLVYSPGEGYDVGDGTPALNALHKKNYFTGRSDNFNADQRSTYANNGRLDPEGIRVSKDGKSVFITDEYGPYVYQFDRESGKRIKAIALPEKFSASVLSAVGDQEITGNTAGRVANKGMEGLAISPDGRFLFGIMQSPLIQDGGTSAPYTRIVKIDTQTNSVREYAYELTNIGSTSKPKFPSVSEILAINDHEFLVDERDGKGLGDDSSAAVKKLYKIDLTNATEVGTYVGADQLAGKAVSKTLFLDLVSSLNAAGFSSDDIPAKIEGLAFGPDVTVGGITKHTLFIANDNDFIATVTDTKHPAGIDNANKFFVFSFDANELPGFVPQLFQSPRN